MNRNTIRVARGQIWYIKDDSPSSKRESGIQSGTRPYVVISSNEGNMSSPIVTILACTTKTKETCNKINVQYHSSTNNVDCLILCNQVRTITKNELFIRGHYLETLNNDVLREVESAYAFAMGLEIKTESDPDADFSKLESLVEKIASAKLKSMRLKTQITDDLVCRIAAGLEELFADQLKDYESIPTQSTPTVHTSVPKYDLSKETPAKAEVVDMPTEVDKDDTDTLGMDPALLQFHNACRNRNVVPNEESETPKKVSNNPETPKSPVRSSGNVSSGKASGQSKRKPNGFWTVERCKEYVEDKKTMNPRQLSDKWDLNGPGAAVSQYYNALNILEKAGIVVETK